MLPFLCAYILAPLHYASVASRPIMIAFEPKAFRDYA